MAKTNKILQSFNAGELSPLMDMRIDQDKYQMGCRTMENFYPLIYGGAERRPGTYFVAQAKSNTAKCRLIDFVYSTSQSYVMEFGNQYIRFYANSGRFVGVLAASTAAWVTGTKYFAGDFAKGSDGDIYRCLITHTSDNGGGDGTGGDPDSDGNPTQWENSTDNALTADNYPIYEVPSPYLTADLFQLKIEQSADVMYITHPNYEPRKLSRISATTFVLEELDFRDGPFQDQNTVTTALMAVSATTGNAITLTASGTNADGSNFEPFKSTGGVDNTGHAPSGATGDAQAGTTQTNKSITGALFKIVHSNESNEINQTFTGISMSSTLFIYKGVKWDWVTNGTWTGTIKLERSYDNSTWEVLHTVVSENNNNVQLDGTEETDDAYYRINATAFTSGSCNTQLTTRDSSHIGIVEITAVASATSATANVLSTIGSTDTTHRWSESHWSNYRGWPNSVAISSEERLTFAGSTSFPLTVWGSVAGDYTSMKSGSLDDDAIVFTLVGSGRQNEILWIISKNSLILGTYGGEHLLGASDENEAMTPTNVRAKIQSTYGSKNIQSKLVGDAVLFVQRGGRRLREMHYDFAKDTQVADDLTVFSNHITESQVVDMAYQRTPDPMIWAVRDDGQLAVMSYERAQEVFSWCRVFTSTNDEESDIESVAVIPTTGEEDQVWISVERTMTGVNSGNPVRYIEYFSTRDY
jgi:hypothetical protein